MRNHKEDDLQAACIKWFRYAYPSVVCLSIPNGGSRNPIEGAKLKRTGTLAGVADLFIMEPYAREILRSDGGFNLERFHGLFIELKTGKNQQTEAQQLFMLNAKNAGYAYHVCRSIDEFMNVIKEYMS